MKPPQAEVGFMWSESADLSNPTDSAVTMGVGNTISLRVPLEGETTYYIAAYATNARGTSTSDTLSLTTYVALTDANIHAAVDEWVADPVTATTTYGDIADWDVSQVTNMNGLFKDETTFNEDISAWDVSNVTTMNNTFNNADAFNRDLSAWDVSQVTSMIRMFTNNSGFDDDISSWDVGSVTNMKEMFWNATAFNSDVSGWNVSGVTDMNSMFQNADAFNSDVSGWDMSNVVTLTEMFAQRRHLKVGI